MHKRDYCVGPCKLDKRRGNKKLEKKEVRNISYFYNEHTNPEKSLVASQT